MSAEEIKLFVPVLVLGAWVLFALKVRSFRVAAASLFFASLAAASANFSFVYREIHQAIQAAMVARVVIETLRTKRTLRINGVFLVLFAFVAVSLLFAPFDADARAQLVNLVVAAGVVNFLFHAVPDRQRLGRVFSFVAQIAVLVAVVGIIERITGASERSEATFSNPNYYAYFLGLGFCLVWSSRAGPKRWVGLVLVLVALVLSGSRIGLVFPVLQVLWSAYRARGLGAVIAGGAVAVGVAWALTVSGATRFSDRDATQASDAERRILVTIALLMGRENPVTGVGWGRFPVEFWSRAAGASVVHTDAGTVDAATRDRAVTHNDFLRILSELGYVALGAAVLLCVNLSFVLLRHKGFGMQHLVPMWVGSIAFSMTHNNLNSALFWFVFLLPLHLKFRLRSENARTSLPRPVSRAVVTSPEPAA
jgi:hypothetical protein